VYQVTQEMPFVSVAIVSHNGRAFLQRCLNSVLKTCYRNFEVVFVDNGSTDGSTKLVMELFGTDPRLRIICKERNLGPAAGRNIGVGVARGKYVAFIDDDTEVDPNWLTEGVNVMESDPSIGAAQCKLLLIDHQDKFDYAGDYLSQYGFLVQRVNFEEVDHGQLDEVVELFGVKSAGMIVRRDVLLHVGDFDEDYFIYMEETDLCWRIWLNNYRVIFIPMSIVYHAFSRKSKLTSTRTKFLTKYLGTKNYITTMIKNLGTWNLVKILPLHIGFWIGIIVWHIMRRRLIEASWIAKGVLYNLTHFRCIWMKRKVVQSLVRKVPDTYIMPRIMRKLPFSYFFGKLTRPNSGWRV
jgi:GT2 family glycosyltransferase